MKLSLLAAVLLCGCPPSPQPPPAPPDASDARAPVSDSAPEAAPAPTPGPLSPNCVAACAAMAAAGCKEGKAATCAVSMTKVESDRLIRTAKGTPVSCTECADSAKTAADVKAICGSSCTP